MNLSDRNRCWNIFRRIKSIGMFHITIFHIVYWSGLPVRSFVRSFVAVDLCFFVNKIRSGEDVA